MAIPAPDEFVRRVQDELEAETPTELARAIGLTDFAAPQRVRRWMTGRNGPDYEGTMLMLDACGWLAMNSDAATATSTRPAQALDEHELAAAIDEVTHVLTRLQRLVDVQEPPQQASDQHRG